MAIIKKSKSGNQVQFIDDTGNMFVTSTKMLQAYLQGWGKFPFILLNRMPIKVSEDRFKKSPVWMPAGMVDIPEEVTTTNDGISTKRLNDGKKQKQYEDKAVWAD